MTQRLPRWPETALRELAILHRLDALNPAQRRLKDQLVQTVVSHVGSGAPINRPPDTEQVWDDWILPHLIGT